MLCLRCHDINMPLSLYQLLLLLSFEKCFLKSARQFRLIELFFIVQSDELEQERVV
jgi:hypothetical protein